MEHRLSLIPKSKRKRAPGCCGGEIQLVPKQHVGRVALLEALGTACRRDEKCKAKFAWAMTTLSRKRLIRVDSLQSVTVQQTAYAKQYLHVNQKGVPENLTVDLREGDTVSFHPPLKFGIEAKPLEFTVVKSSFQKDHYVSALENIMGSNTSNTPLLGVDEKQVTLGTGYLYSQPNSPVRCVEASRFLEPTFEKGLLNEHASPDQPEFKMKEDERSPINKQDTSDRLEDWTLAIRRQSSDEQTLGSRSSSPTPQRKLRMEKTINHNLYWRRNRSPRKSIGHQPPDEISTTSSKRRRSVASPVLDGALSPSNAVQLSSQRSDVSNTKEQTGSQQSVLLNDDTSVVSENVPSQPFDSPQQTTTPQRNQTLGMNRKRKSLPSNTKLQSGICDQIFCQSPNSHQSKRSKSFGSPLEARDNLCCLKQLEAVAAVLEPHDNNNKNTTTDIAAAASISEDQKTADQSPTRARFVLFFVPKGSDMHKDLIQGNKTMEGLRTHCELRGAQVLDTFDKEKPPFPTHLVISERIQSRWSIVKALGFQSDDEMIEFVGQHNICCVRRSWAAKGKGQSRIPLAPPSMKELYLGLNPQRPRIQKPGDSNPATSYRNRLIADHFAELSKLYRKCPLKPQDEWKSYTFSVLSGRLRRLPFEITEDQHVIERLKRTSGFGKSSVCIIQEFLTDGTSSRRLEFDREPQRRAMKVMMGIWGVGRATATELVTKGYKHIGNVRKSVADGILKLERNQYIGLLCYEDILGDMTRSEVESIAQVIRIAVKRHHPDAEFQIMGSYRRGSQGCGDVDILITDRSYPVALPQNALSDVLDDLTAEGHIAYHLTKTPGVKKFETLLKQQMRFLSNPEPRTYARGTAKSGCSSWMGVFKSPFSGQVRMRRVDIKFYPHHQRVFASLYFTGNGHFNRSIRLWAKKKHQYRLSDLGLFDTTAGKPVVTNPSSEKEIFDMLKLKWKEPNERDCFDAVESSDGSLIPEASSRQDFEAVNEDYDWID